MSSREFADKARIEQFLRLLGERFRRPGRIYLVGGTTMVFEGFRSQSLDVDLALEVEASDHSALIQAIRELKDKLALNVEEASPADFIPLPAGYQARAVFIKRYGALDVFHFDPYSTALSKIARGTEEDFADVLALLRAGWLDLATLEQYFREIQPRLTTESLKQDPNEFARNLQAVRELAARG